MAVMPAVYAGSLLRNSLVLRNRSADFTPIFPPLRIAASVKTCDHYERADFDAESTGHTDICAGSRSRRKDHWHCYGRRANSAHNCSNVTA